MNASSRRFHEGQVKALGEELDALDRQIAELTERRDAVVDKLEYHEDKLGM
jgi:chorismate mutase